MRPFRFGVVVGDAGSGEDWVLKARKAEDLGYSTLLVPDHFMPQLSPMIALAAAARMLRLAAREAEIVAINSSTSSGTLSLETWRDATTSSFKRKISIVREAAGARIDGIELAAWVFFTNIIADRAGAASQLANAMVVGPSEILENQSTLIGPT